MRPKAIKNAAIMRTSVSGPVLVLVISFAVGFGVTTGLDGGVTVVVTVVAATVNVAHSYAVLAALSFADESMTCDTTGIRSIPTTSPFFLSVFSSLYPAPSSDS